MAASKLVWRTFLPLAFVLVASALFVHRGGQRTGSRAKATAPLDDWDIPRLVAYLNGKGLRLRAMSTMNGRDSDRSAFLTTTDKVWEELSRPIRDRSHIDRWRGTLYCERGQPGENWADRTGEWGDCCLVVGPFLLFGDRELLGRVRAALADLTLPEDRAAGRTLLWS
jgi:hypothetical protein